MNVCEKLEGFFQECGVVPLAEMDQDEGGLRVRFDHGAKVVPVDVPALLGFFRAHFVVYKGALDEEHRQVFQDALVREDLDRSVPKER